MSNEIRIIERDGDDPFVVRVTEDGETRDKEFAILEHARSWAAGQSIRLGLSRETTTAMKDAK